MSIIFFTEIRCSLQMIEDENINILDSNFKKYVGEDVGFSEVIHFTCPQEYYLDGSKESVCLPNEQLHFSDGLPNCKGLLHFIFNSKYSLFTCFDIFV